MYLKAGEELVEFGLKAFNAYCSGKGKKDTEVALSQLGNVRIVQTIAVGDIQPIRTQALE